MTLPWQPLPAESALAASTLQRIHATVAIATGLAECGRAIDLAGLDSATGALCAQVLDLPPEDGSSMREALVQLQARLVALSATVAASSQAIQRT